MVLIVHDAVVVVKLFIHGESVFEFDRVQWKAAMTVNWYFDFS